MNKLTILCLYLLLGFFGIISHQAAAQALSNSATIVVPAGNTLSITGDFTNEAAGDIQLDGVLHIYGDWINHKEGLMLGGEVLFTGNGQKKIGGTEPTVFNDLTIVSGSEVILGEVEGDTKYATVSGTFTNQNGASGFSMKPGASLIHKTPEVAANIELEVTGSGWDWHMLSSPVAAQSINPGFHDGSFYAWHEPAQTWVSYTNNLVWPTWENTNTATNTFDVGRGYMVAYPGTPTKTFSGSMNQGQVDFALQRLAHPDDTYEGFNQLGNPYPSSIDWKAASGWSGRQYLQVPSGADTSGYNMWVWNDSDGNYGAHNSASIGDYIHLGVSRYIAPMQAFWVRAENHGETFGMDNRVRLHSEQQWLKAQAEVPGVLQLAVTGNANSYRDEIILEFGHKSDRGGAEKMFSMYDAAPGMYSKKQNQQWSISFLTSTTEHPVVPVGFRAGDDGIYTISASGAAYFGEVMLEDLHKGLKHSLTLMSHYHFSAKSGDQPDRFLLHFKATAVDNHHTPQPHVYYSLEQLHVFNPWPHSANVQVFDAGGRLLRQFTAPNQGKHSYGFKPQPGMYLVRILSDNRVFTEKIVIL